MKYLPVIIFSLFLSGCSSGGNMPLSKEYSRIENRAADTDRMMSSFSSADQTMDDGSLITSYYHDGTLKKVHIEQSVQGGLASRDCYFHNWKISYISDTETRLDMGSGNNTTREIYYFKDDKLIGWKNSDGEMITKGNEFNKREKKLLEDVENYLLLNQ